MKDVRWTVERAFDFVMTSRRFALIWERASALNEESARGRAGALRSSPSPVSPSGVRASYAPEPVSRYWRNPRNVNFSSASQRSNSTVSSMSLGGTGIDLPEPEARASRSSAISKALARMACQSSTQTPTSERTERISASSSVRASASATRWVSMCIQDSARPPFAGASMSVPSASRRTGTMGWTNTEMSMLFLRNRPVRESTRNGESSQMMSMRVEEAASGPSASSGQSSSSAIWPGARTSAKRRWWAVVSKSCWALRPTRSSSATRLQ